MQVNENGKVVIYPPNSNEPIERLPIDANELVRDFGFTFEPAEVKKAARTAAE